MRLLNNHCVNCSRCQITDRKSWDILWKTWHTYLVMSLKNISGSFRVFMVDTNAENYFVNIPCSCLQQSHFIWRENRRTNVYGCICTRHENKEILAVIIALEPPHNFTFFYKLISLLKAFCEMLLILWAVAKSGYKHWNMTIGTITNSNEKNG
jgi:hypothetical protein